MTPTVGFEPTSRTVQDPLVASTAQLLQRSPIGLSGTQASRVILA